MKKMVPMSKSENKKETTIILAFELKIIQVTFME